jgi:hypothetical protein
MGVLAILSLVLPVLTSALQSYKVVPANLGAIIDSIVALIPGLVGFIKSSQNETASIPSGIMALLAAISTQVQVLKADTTLDPTVLSNIVALDDIITKTLAEDQAASKAIDLSVLTDIPPAP